MVYQKVDTPGQSAYGVVVVGLNHINDHKLSVRNLLEQRGLRCEIVDLSACE